MTDRLIVTQFFLWMLKLGMATGTLLTQEGPRPQLTARMDGGGNVTVTWNKQDVMRGPLLTEPVSFRAEGRSYGPLQDIKHEPEKLKTCRWYRDADETLTVQVVGSELVYTATIHNKSQEPIEIASVLLPLLKVAPTGQSFHFSDQLNANGAGWGNLYPNYWLRIGGAWAGFKGGLHIGSAIEFGQPEQWRFFMGGRFNPWPTTWERWLGCAVARRIEPGTVVTIKTRWMFSSEPGNHLLNPHKEELQRCYGTNRLKEWDGRPIVMGQDWQPDRRATPFADRSSTRISWLEMARSRGCQGYVGWGFAQEPFYQPWESYPVDSADLDLPNLSALNAMRATERPGFAVGWLVRPALVPYWNAAGQRRLIPAPAPGKPAPLYYGLLSERIPYLAYLDDFGLGDSTPTERKRFDTEILYELAKIRPNTRWTVEFANDQTIYQGHGVYSWWHHGTTTTGDQDGYDAMIVGWKQQELFSYLSDGRMYGMVSSADPSTWSNETRRAIAVRYKLAPLVDDWMVNTLPSLPVPAP